MESFFIVCPIGLEQLCQQEIELKWKRFFGDAHRTINAIPGGIELQCDLKLGLQLNYYLKIPSRILLRIGSKKCRDLPRLYSYLKSLNWRKYLNQTNLEFNISCQQSRLMHSGRIQASAIESLKEYFQANPPPQFFLNQTYPDQKVFLRLNNDELTVSLDTSGEHLHKRSVSFRGKAGLRETFAAACLFALTQGQEVNLLDPMCGSGTALREQKNFNQLSQRPYAFENWAFTLDKPCVEIHEYLGQLVGIERDPNIFKNLNSDFIGYHHGDFFKLDPNKYRDFYLFMNPPYGKRIKIESQKSKYFQNIVAKIVELAPKQAGIIIPKPFSSSFKARKRLAFNQNGINVEFLIL